MAWFAEQKNIFGKWTPIKTAEKPDQKKPGARQSEVKNVVEIPKVYDHLTLAQLFHVLSPDGRFYGVRK